MKRLPFLLILIISALLCSCATSRTEEEIPAWVNEIPASDSVLYGIGKAKLLIDSNSQQAADASARSDLALKINVNIKDALAVYSNEASSVVTSAFETIILQSVNLTMKSVVVEQHWSAADGTVWSLVSFPVSDLPALYADAANDYLNQLEEKRINTLQKLIDLLAELGDATDDNSVKLKKLAQEKADSILSEVDEITESIDVDLHVRRIKDYLVVKGFELND